MQPSFDAKVKGTKKLAGQFPVFVFALSQFTKPDYLGAWNRLLVDKYKLKMSEGYIVSSYVHCV